MRNKVTKCPQEPYSLAQDALKYYSGQNKKIKRELKDDLDTEYEGASSETGSDHLLMTNKFTRVRRLGFKIIRYVDRFNHSVHVSSPFSHLYNKLDDYVSDKSALCIKLP